MPPKQTEQGASAESIIEIATKFEGGNGTEADYKKLLTGVTKSSECRLKVAQTIPRCYSKFEKLESESLSAIISLLKDQESEIRIHSVRSLKEFSSKYPEKVIKAYLSTLDDEDLRILNISVPIVETHLGNEESRSHILKYLPECNPASQAKIIEMIKTKMTFNEENVNVLLSIIEIALKSSVLDGLRLMAKNKKLLSDEKKAELASSLLNRLDSSLKDNFEEVCSHLLSDILKFTRTIGDESTTKLLDIIQNHILPKIQTLEEDLRIKVVQRIADLSNLVPNEELFISLYNNVYLHFPASGTTETPINFLYLEAFLWAFFKLSKKFTRCASSLIGKHLVLTGQPGENNNVKESEELYQQFLHRLHFAENLAPKFVEHIQSQLDHFIKEVKDEDDSERRKTIYQLKVARKSGNNVRHFCRIFARSNLVSENPPKSPSWHKLKFKHKRFNNNFKSRGNYKDNRNNNYRNSNNRDRNNQRDFKPRENYNKDNQRYHKRDNYRRDRY